ncbi:MAG: tetratricopeptide repeat protein [Candidatus Aminicenantes bacterium]|nr:MAG: tetratricopeptide repeat protein [Candidatus Aminicenantes bacterium]
MTEVKEKVKRDQYQKALSAYAQAMKAFHKGEYGKASEALKAFLSKHTSEIEFVDRAKIYLAICEGRLKKESIPLKTFDDYYQYGVYRLNQGEYKKALELLERARDKKPKEGKIFYLMALTYCLMKETEQCLENLKRAIQLDKYFKILAQNEENFEVLKKNKKFNLITRMA